MNTPLCLSLSYTHTQQYSYFCLLCGEKKKKLSNNSQLMSTWKPWCYSEHLNQVILIKSIGTTLHPFLASVNVLVQQALFRVSLCCSELAYSPQELAVSLGKGLDRAEAKQFSSFHQWWREKGSVKYSSELWLQCLTGKLWFNLDWWISFNIAVSKY